MSERIFSESEVIMLVGYLNTAIPALHSVLSTDILVHAEEGMRIIEEERDKL